MSTPGWTSARSRFSISQGNIILVKAGANGGGTVGHYYQYKPATPDGSDSVLLEQENYANTARWTDLGTANLSDEDKARPIYDSNVTAQFKTALNRKFYVIKPVEMKAPTLSYVNVGNLLIEQRNQLVAWILNHAGDSEALARYQVQLEAIDETLEGLGLTQYVTQVKYRPRGVRCDRQQALQLRRPRQPGSAHHDRGDDPHRGEFPRYQPLDTADSHHDPGRRHQQHHDGLASGSSSANSTRCS
jgi:hypothetical protein